MRGTNACAAGSGTPMSMYRRAWSPKIFTWSIVCDAAVAWSSSGRSALITRSGTRASAASITAG